MAHGHSALRAGTRLHRDWLQEESGWTSDPRLEAELDFLEGEGLLLSDQEFEFRVEARLPLDPWNLASDQPDARADDTATTS